MGHRQPCEKQLGDCPPGLGLPHCSAFLSTSRQWQKGLQQVTWVFFPALPFASLEVSGTHFPAQSLSFLLRKWDELHWADTLVGSNESGYKRCHTPEGPLIGARKPTPRSHCSSQCWCLAWVDVWAAGWLVRVGRRVARQADHSGFRVGLKAHPFSKY